MAQMLTPRASALVLQLMELGASAQKYLDSNPTASPFFNAHRHIQAQRQVSGLERVQAILAAGPQPGRDLSTDVSRQALPAIRA